MKNDIKAIYFSEEDIAKMNARLGEEISRDYEGKCPVFVGLLKGVLPFLSDLMKNVTGYCTVEYMKASSYAGTKSTGNVHIKGDMPEVKGKDVIIVDDILDTGRTLKAVIELFESLGATSVKTCVLLDKPEGRKVDVHADYVGGLVPNEFVVGYGLDYDEKYRNLPYIGVLKEEVYQK